MSALLFASACGSDPEPPPDAGPADAGADAGIMDAMPVDAGPLTVTLQVDFEGDGLGRVVSTPAGLDCNEDCTVEFEPGLEVTLTATAAQGVVFVGWTGAGCDTSPSCTVTLDADLRLSAKFSRFFTLTVEPVGEGLGAVDVQDGARCVGSCDLPVLSDTLVIVHAVPAAGVEFVGWTGACSGPDPECRVGINGNKFLRPFFEVKVPQVAGGDGHFCALIRADTLRCWGRGAEGQLGWQSDENIGDDEAVRDQGALQTGVQVMQVDLGGAHTCVLGRSGEVRCWGDNAYGQLGQGSLQSVGGASDPAPADAPNVDLGGPAMQVAAGGAHTCALMMSGGVRCWGRGAEGQLGYGNAAQVGDGVGLSPAEAGDVPLGAPATFVAAGGQHSCAVLVGGQVKCWGSNAKGQLGYAFGGQAGDGTAGRAVPADLEALPLGAPVQALELAEGHSCVRYEDRRVRCFGDNSHGQLGDGDTQQVGGAGGLSLDTGIDVLLGQDRVVDLAVGASHACVSLQDGSVRCWGSGAQGATGSEAVRDESTPLLPVSLIAGHRAVALASARQTTCLATRFGQAVTDAAVLCWGSGQDGALASGSTTNVGDRPGTMPPAPSSVY